MISLNKIEAWVLLVVLIFASFSLILGVGKYSAYEDLVGADYELIQSAKADCEKSGKECVIVWDFVEVEADYE